MAEGAFTITELKRTGAATIETEEGERFVWTSDRTPPDPTLGGGRAAPLQPWTMGLSQRMVRTDYPGGRKPSHQVLGPARKPFVLRGRWDDRYNFIGYAEQELRRFEGLVSRGNVARFQYGNQVFEGIISDFNPSYRRSWHIDYEFQVDVIQRAEDAQIDAALPAATRSPAESFDELDIMVQGAEDAQLDAPRGELQTDLADRTDEQLVGIIEQRDEIASTLDQNELEAFQASPLRRISSQFLEARSRALDLVDETIVARSDVDMGVRTAVSVLNFESWIRTVRFNARIIGLSSARASDDLIRRDDPGAVTFYRPRQGESLYSISRRFYGTPFAWDEIRKRNRLIGLTLTGEELLVIPRL
jgi:nucleoid-associated protein YgaU